MGESTKAASHGYIGAKGIGFKSVFIAAWKVEIQSGNYAFYFKHNREDIGLGMVLPVWQDVDSDDIPDSLTRMTLHLHQNGDPDEIEHLHSTIFEQFTSLEETCLLFLRNLKEIRVSFYTTDERLQESKRFYLEGDSSWKVSLNVESVDEDGEESIRVHDYYVSRYVGIGLPKSDNRDIPASPEAQEASSRAETILAFPVDQENRPILQPQSVFAFLPIRKTSFKVGGGITSLSEPQLTCHSFSFNRTLIRMQVDRTSLSRPDETLSSSIISPPPFAKQFPILRLMKKCRTRGQDIFHPSMNLLPISGSLFL